MLITSSMHLLAGSSLKSSAFLHKAHRQLVYTALENIGQNVVDLNDPRNDFAPALDDISRQSDARKIMHRLDLIPRTVGFICCSRCFTLHHERDAKEAVFICRNLLDPLTGQICGEQAAVQQRQIMVQSLINWIGRMLGRANVEKELEDASYQQRPPLEATSSILNAAWVRSLAGKDGRPFLPSLPPELNLLLSVNVDGFHPLGLKPAGAHYTSTGIYLALLSLPANLRYRKENMFFFTLIPGPEAPHGEQLNSILSPLVDELEALWSGVHYSCTARKPGGRLVRAAMGCIVCDLVAALQVAGLAHHSSDILPCAFCHIRGAEMKQSSARARAPLRSRAQLEQLGQEWLELNSTSKRQKHFKQHGVRFTVFSRLPYFDITRSKVIDAMHAFFLNGVSRHINSLLGMDSRVPETSEVSSPQLLHEADLFDAEIILRSKIPSKVAALGRLALVSLCHARGLRCAGSAKSLMAVLWVSPLACLRCVLTPSCFRDMSLVKI